MYCVEFEELSIQMRQSDHLHFKVEISENREDIDFQSVLSFDNVPVELAPLPADDFARKTSICAIPIKS